MEILERRPEDLEGAVLVIADDLRIVAFEVTAIGGREVVFRVDTVDISRLVEVLIGARQSSITTDSPSSPLATR